MHSLRFAPLLLGCAIWVIACSRSENIPARTQVLLQVSCEDAELRARLTHLEVSLALEEGSGFRTPVTSSFASDVLKWPVEFPITPRVAADASKRFQVVVEAKQDGEVLVQTRVIAGFAQGQLRILPLLLQRCGERGLGFVCAASDCRGEGCDVCAANGDCEPVMVVKPEDLPPFVPDPDTDTPDGGAPPSDAEVPTDADMDADDGALSPDAYVQGETGTPCPPELDTQRACEGHASRTALKCTEGNWQVAQTCAADERCDSRAGAAQGSCAPVPSACVDKVAGDVCDGAALLTCGIDLVTVRQRSCPEHMHCDASAGARCVCDTGFDSDGKGGCANPNDCPPAACAGGNCVDGDGDYSCDCGQGYTGSGTKKCTPAKYCPEDACYPGGSCVDMQNWSCTCDAGFAGTGTRSCDNIDDCPKDRCKAPNGTCQDGVSTYACKCNPGFSGPDCANDICAPNPCRNGGTCSRTGTLCTCATGFMGDNCEQALDRCAAGAVAVCGAGATKCTSTAGAWACTCAGRYVLSPDSKSCLRRAWSAPVLVENSTTGDATPGPVAADGTGNIMVVWYQHDGTRNNLWARRLGSSGSWGSPTLLETNDTGDVQAAVLSMNSRGEAVVAWQLSDGQRFTVWAAVFKNGAWGAAARVDTVTTSAGEPKASMDSDGNATVIWHESGGPNSSKLWASRSSGGAWGTPSLLEPGGHGAVNSHEVVQDSANQVLVIWSTNPTSGMGRVWESHRDAEGRWSASAPIPIGPGSFGFVRLAASLVGLEVAVVEMYDGAQVSLYSSFRLAGSWGNATLLETYTGSGASVGPLAIDRVGNSTLLWAQLPNGNQGLSLVASRATVAGVWSAPTPLENETYSSNYPRLTVNSNIDDAIALFTQDRAVPPPPLFAIATDVRATYFTKAGGWAETEVLATGKQDALSSGDIAIDNSGRALATWSQSDGTRRRLWASRLE